MRFYYCTNCNEVVMFNNVSPLVKCCDQDMIELLPNQNEEDFDAHQPIIRKFGNLVTVLVGNAPHSMVEVHHIDFIILETNKGTYYKKLNLEDDAIADFLVHNQEEVLRAYVYCNNHFLYVSEDVKDFTKEIK